VPCPEWGLDLTVRTLTGTERDELENTWHTRRVAKDDSILGIKILLVQSTVVDEDGLQVFDVGERDLLNGKSAKVIDRLFQTAQRLSGLTDDDIQEMAGNLNGGPNAASGSV
jgi:hypothetical protein